jgi:CheY-like chemotaxis protein
VVFVLTTSAAESDVARAYEEGVAGYLTKSTLGPQLRGLARFLTEYGSATVLPSTR